MQCCYCCIECKGGENHFLDDDDNVDGSRDDDDDRNGNIRCDDGLRGGMARLGSARPTEANLAATKRCVFSRLTEDFRSTSQLNNDLSHFDLHPTPALMR